MNEHPLHAKGMRPAGYSELIERFTLNVIPNWHRSLVSPGNTHRIDTSAGIVEEVYPLRYWPGDTLCDHLQFALKYDGTNLAILASVFQVAPMEEIQQYVQSTPRGKYARRIWFLYEMLTGSELPLADQPCSASNAAPTAWACSPRRAGRIWRASGGIHR